MKEKINITEIDFDKYEQGLVPAIVQDIRSGTVLMLGFMSKESLEKTIELGKVTFFSRSRSKLWTKGETSGNFLLLEEIKLDCDKDTLLIMANPAGMTCHEGKFSCFGEASQGSKGVGFLADLEKLVRERKENPSDESYTSSLFREGRGRISRKVGEEAVELIIEAMSGEREKFEEETADLLFHLITLVVEQGSSLEAIVDVLKKRSK